MNTENNEDKNINQEEESSVIFTEKPRVFDYIDFRKYLKESYLYRKNVNAAYSESAFILAAGLAKTSRGYFGLIVRGKRNLASSSIFGFAKALKLDPKESMYFENMVYFNQAKKEEERIFYFERMKIALQGERSELFEILEGQRLYVSKWYLVVLRELVSLKDFVEEEAFIVKKLKKQISKEQAKEGLEVLLKLGLLTRNPNGRLVPSEPVVTFTDNQHNFKSTTELHQQFIDKAKSLLVDEPYEKRSARLVTIACDIAQFDSIREEMRIFSRTLLKKYGSSARQNASTVLQLGMQLFHVTE